MDKQYVLNGLKDFISIQSVSANPEKYSEIQKAASFLKEKLSSLGFSVELLEKGKFPPLVVAHKEVSSSAKTIGIYGHYDVQPEDPVEEWNTKPFELTAKNGKVWARGVADDKGHVWQNIVALEQLIQEDKLQNNIVCIFEGEEESGSVNFEEFVNTKKELLSRVDVFYVVDMGMHSRNVPQIFYGLRGLVYFELEVAMGTKDLHSGIYGNRVFNPANVLAELLGKMKDSKSGKVLIPRFYDDVRKLSDEELKLLEKVERSNEEEQAKAGSFAVTGVDGLPAYLASKIAPSLDINGLISGYNGPGPKTVIPKNAKAKFSIRLVEHQDPGKIQQLVKNFVKEHMPQGVKYELTSSEGHPAFYTSIENEWMQKSAKVLQTVFGHETLFNRSGGSVPAAEILCRVFKKPAILLGFTLPDENMHSPNENYDEEMFWKGIEALKKLYS